MTVPALQTWRGSAPPPNSATKPGRPEVRRASRKATGFEKMEALGPTPGPWSQVSGIPPSFSPRRNRIPPFQGMGASPGPFPSASSPAGMQGPRGDFRIPGLLGAPRGTASNSPKELISIQKPRTFWGSHSPCLHPGWFLTCPGLSGKWTGTQAREDTSISQCKARVPAAPVSGAAHPSEP